MGPWGPIIAQLIPILTPYILELIQMLLAKIGTHLPPVVVPPLNALLGAIVATLAGDNPATGALLAHVVRSGMKHEAAPAPK